jgi:hypothetical protein
MDKSFAWYGVEMGMWRSIQHLLFDSDEFVLCTANRRMYCTWASMIPLMIPYR